MKLFRARAYMAAPLILNAPLHLDALLVWAHCHAGGYHESDTFIRPDSYRLPILCLYAYPGGKKDWVWCASAGMPSDEKLFSRVSFVKRRNDEDDLQLLKPRSDKSGPWRNWFEHRSALNCLYMDFYGFGHIEKVEELLGHVKGIGVLRRQGFGQVKNWEIGETAGDPMSAVVSRGRAMRSIPVSFLDKYRASKVAVCAPPYHHTQRQQASCLVSGSVTLKPEIVKTWTRQINEPVRRTDRRRKNRIRRARDAKKEQVAPI